ncbi:MAG: enoyl-ACP reductase FabI [Mycobacteriales bacterium]|nr:MAG: enoyl-[acyl-carrier-protein] reductase FabI [Pseudonocardiales bacterium]
MAGLLAGKRVLVAGVLTEASIGFAVAKAAQQHGAQVVVSNFGRGLSITRRIVGRLPQPAPVVVLDVTHDEHLATLAERLREHVDGIDGVVHAIAFAPQAAMGDGFVDVAWSDAATALQVSTWSFAALIRACLPLVGGGGASVVGFDFDASVAWPAYGWMGVAKAGLESATRYLARELGPRGVRVNLVSAGPLQSMAKRSIPGADVFDDAWNERAPLGWNHSDFAPAATATVALLSDLLPATTGEIIHVDGGYHAVGA